MGHDPSEPQNILGKAVDIQLDQSGKSQLTAQFDAAGINPKADLIYRQVKAGTRRTVSAGFIPHTMEFEDDVPLLKDNELLEVSVVAIPANRNALALSFESGGLDTKDASFLIKSMRDEADSIGAEPIASLTRSLRSFATRALS
ncbi:HK97 family phage prohead protease [Rathayibacter sp. VKM Ac-2759]|uniref:HK97 family phage prohead protease n=1 Tax=Rathayibacter sp. VKM Ac-2759 TaxID=2609252 RepID=UPI0032994B48